MPAQYNRATHTITLKVPVRVAQLLRVFITNGDMVTLHNCFGNTMSSQVFRREFDDALHEAGAYLTSAERRAMYNHYIRGEVDTARHGIL